MTKRFITYNKISDFKGAIRNITHSTRYIGLDASGGAMYDQLIKLPVVEVLGTEKIHGTNAAVCYGDGEFWVQSRKNIITLEQDNAGCALAVYGTKSTAGSKDAWMTIIHDLSEQYNINLEENIISVYFEWAGGNIQDHSALTNNEKISIVFAHFKVSPVVPILEGEEHVSYWLSTSGVHNTENNIFNVCNFPMYELSIDFNVPKLSQNKMIDMVTTLEEASPIGKSFGHVANIGEGIVFTCLHQGNIVKWKVKGDKHSKSKVKKLKPVDNVLEQKKQDEAERCTPAWRLEQGLKEVFGDDELVKARTGEFLKWMSNDIILEETANILDCNLQVKDVLGVASRISRMWLFEQINIQSGL